MLRRTMSLAVTGLFKRFGAITALDGLELEVPERHVFGFLGSNGAGKTTTMRIALGVLRADSGSIRWRGADHRTLPRHTWGYLPEERGLYPKMTVLQQLVFFAGLQGLPRDVATREAKSWLRALPRPGVRRPARRGALEGQPAEGPVPRGRPARPAGPAHGRAVHGPRPGEHRAAARGDPRAPRPRQDDRAVDPPDGDGRGDVRIGRDRRPRAHGRRRLARGREALDRPTDGAPRGPRRPQAGSGSLAFPARGSSDPASSGPRSRSSRTSSPRRSSPRRSPPARASPTSRSPTRRSSRCSSSTSATPPTRIRRPPRGRVPALVRRRRRSGAARPPDRRPRTARRSRERGADGPAGARPRRELVARREARVPRARPEPPVLRLDDPARGTRRRRVADPRPDQGHGSGDEHQDRGRQRRRTARGRIRRHPERHPQPAVQWRRRRIHTSSSRRPSRMPRRMRSKAVRMQGP